MTAARSRDGWEIVERRGSVAELHARPLAARARLAEVLAWRRTALVLGSTQPISTADQAAADRLGADVVRRRSGGGAVLLHPGLDTWVDVTIPRDDPLWDDDVAASFHWLGRAWVVALGRLGIAAEVHLVPSATTAWSRRVCFAGLGAGEVTIADPTGHVRKAVGLAQRRNRDGARFQCLVPGLWDAAALLALLALDDDERAEGTLVLSDVATGPGRLSADVAAAFVASLPE